MSWRLKLSNQLSGGALDKFKEQARLAKAKLQQIESETENSRTNIQKIEKELAQAKAQLQINQGFQIELGETQMQLQKVKANLSDCQKRLIVSEQQLKQSQSKLRKTTKELANSQNWLQQIQTPIEVVDVVKTLPKQDFDTLWGFGIGVPKVNDRATAGAIIVKGWVLGKKAKATAVRVVYNDQSILEIPVNQPRPAIVQQYPDIANAAESGFESSLAVTGLPPEAKLQLFALLDDDSIIPLCAIALKSQVVSS